jgi:predicted RNA-binding protein YlqC (UPF0109 family)
MKEFIERIAKELVDSPGEVDVEVLEEIDTTRIKLVVANEDMGRIIGRRGQTINSIRILMKAVGKRIGKKPVLDILESSSVRPR